MCVYIYIFSNESDLDVLVSEHMLMGGVYIRFFCYNVDKHEL